MAPEKKGVWQTGSSLGLHNSAVESLQVGQEGQQEPFLLIHWSSLQFGFAQRTSEQILTGWQTGQQVRSTLVATVPGGHVGHVKPATFAHEGLGSHLGQQSPSW